MKILIVEDEVLLANSLKTLLEKKGFIVEGFIKKRRDSSSIVTRLERCCVR